MKHSHAIETSLDSSPQTRWLKKLDSVDKPGDLGQLIIDHVKDYAECVEATVLWELDGLSDRVDRDGLSRSAWLNDVAVSGIPRYAPEQQEVAFRLCLEPRPVLLLLTLRKNCKAEYVITALYPMLQLAGRRLRTLLKWGERELFLRQLGRSERLHRVLFEIADLAGSDRDFLEVLRRIHWAIQTLVYAENFFIVLHDEPSASIRYAYYADVIDSDIPCSDVVVPLSSIENSLTWYLVTQGKKMMGSVAKMRDELTGSLVVIGPPCADFLGVPMLRDGGVRGAVVVQSYSGDMRYSDDDMALLEFVSTHILTALERKQAKSELELQVQLRTSELASANAGLERHIEELQRAEQLQRALYQIANLATADIEQREFYKCVHSVVGQFLNAENFFISLISSCGQQLDYPYAVNETGVAPAFQPIAGTMSERILRQGRASLGDSRTIKDLMDAGEIEPWKDEPVPTSWLAAPLIVGKKAVGLIVVQHYGDEAAYSEADRDLLGFVAMQIAHSLDRRRSARSLQRRVEERTRDLHAEILERKRVQSELSHQVMHDLLTGLPNRRYLRDRIEQLQGVMQGEHQRKFALIYLDVDRFKNINDGLGHQAGDEVLMAVGVYLWDCIRHPDLAVRLSGDEFAILLMSVDAPAEALQVAQRIMDKFGKPMPIAGRDLQVSVSLGIVVCDDHYKTVDQVLHDADVALYRAKRGGRRRFEIFDERMAKGVIDQLAMEADLRLALEQNQFEPYFQPICRLSDGGVAGYEALIRWNHPKLGVLEPAQFLRVAQNCKLLETIDWKMFELSFRSFARHAREGTYITFNVSALHLGYEDFDTRLIALLESSGLARERVVVEITEEVLLDEPEAVRLMLNRLRAVGIGTALDDFGTGYSSLRYLHTLPLHMLKIDRAFVSELDKPREINSSTVVAAILALARTLGIEVIAEGIETQSQYNELIKMGCHLGQGYLLGRPHSVLGGFAPETKRDTLVDTKKLEPS